MSIAGRTRSALGAHTRSPLGAFDDEAAPVPPSPLNIISGVSSNALRFFGPLTWGVGDLNAEPIEAKCRFSRTFAGDDGYYSLITLQQYVDPGPYQPEQIPSHLDLLFYTFISDTTGGRWRPSDHFGFICETSGGTVSARSSAGGSSPTPGYGTLGDLPVADVSFNVTVEVGAPGTAQHPDMPPNSFFTAYPPGRVPP